MPRRLVRRSVLKLLGTGAAALCPVCYQLTVARAAAPGAPAGGGAAHHPHWGYEGAGAPEHWGSLEPQFKVCELGMEQTPIDLAGAIRAELGGVEVAFGDMPLRIVNNGHTIQVNCAPGSAARINGTRYELLQFHFHHPSEHLLSGKSFELECHFVHRSGAGDLAVVGVFIKQGAHNEALAPIWDAMPREAGPERTAGTVRPADLLPRARGYFRYAGSLTTPPCSEGLTWTVFKDPIEASSEQIRRFAQLFPMNARPVQAVHRRFLLETQ
ncbi:MAG: carbonic anhydrase [Pseudomonadota bacterium]